MQADYLRTPPAYSSGDERSRCTKYADYEASKQKQAALLRKLVWNAEKRIVRTDEEGKLSLNTKLPDGLLF